MSRKYLLFVILIGFVSLLIGCNAGGSAPFAQNNGETTVLPVTRNVDENGRFDDITFPSGAVIKCHNNNTFKEGVIVTANEEKVPVITDNSGKFNYIYLYNISAVLSSDNPLEEKVSVNTIEKPLSVTLPNDSTTGTCYIGTRASEKDPWRYSLVTDGITSNARFMRLSAKPSKYANFNLFRLNIQFRLFSFDNEGSDKGEVDSVALSTGSEDNKITAKDGKYTEDLQIKLTLSGDKLDSFKADALSARIIYRSKNQTPAQLKANGSIVKQTDSNDKAVTGGYEHSFEISNITVDSQMSGEAVLSFVLNLNGINLEDFPTDFLVEFYSDTKDEKTIPFTYTQAFSFETKEEEPETYSLTLVAGTGIDSVGENKAYKAGESITLEYSLKDGYEFEKWTNTKGESVTSPFTMPAEAVTLTANAKVKTYNITYKAIENSTFETANPTSYTIESDDITLNNPTKTNYEFCGWTYEGQTTPQTEVKIEKGSTTGDKEFTAHFNLPVTLAIAADDGVMIDDTNSLYYTKPTFTITSTLAEGVTMTDTEKANILLAVSVKDAAGTSFGNATATWNNDGKIALSFLKDLTASTTFTISFGDAEGVAITCTPFTFKTFYFKGKGTPDNRYQVESAEQLDCVKNYLDKHYVQTADFDLGAYSENWSAIGGSEEAPFIGSYCGNGYKIKNLTIRTSELVVSGLFGYVGSNGKKSEIASITVDGVSIRDEYNGNIGIIACFLYGDGSSIKNCLVTNSSGNNSEVMGRWVGGICFQINKKADNILIQNCKVENCDFKFSTAGEGVDICGICYDSNYSTIDSCHVENVNIICEKFISAYVSGICNTNKIAVKDCTVKNSKIICVSSAENSYIGVSGICNNMLSTIDGCSLSNTTIKVESTSPNGVVRVGGICCNHQASGVSLKNSYVENSVLTASGTYGEVGGIVAYGEKGTIESCFISGIKIYCEDLGDDTHCFNVGGIIGKNGIKHTIKTCYTTNSTINFTAKKNGEEAYIGGICGYNNYSSSITSCYIYDSDNTHITGSGNNYYLGYLVGKNDSSNVSDCFTNLNVAESTLIGESSGTVEKCYTNVSNKDTFVGKTWSDGAWNDYNTSSFPPTLK